jgi:hypothetical protein
MKRAVWWLILLIGVGIFALILYHAWQKARPVPQAAPSAAAPTPKEAAEPSIRYPIRQETEKKPLPALDASDAAVREALAGLWDAKTLEQHFLLKDFVRRIVATIDNLPRARLAQRLMPVQPAAGSFLTTGKDADLAISTKNAARYASYMRLAEAVDASKLVALYARFYPLFQQAYRELGYPQGYFNDRLVEVINHLLGAPDVKAPVRLVRPKVFYQFADPELESRSAGQKILMRIGRDNAARVKAKLRELRAELTRHGLKE